MPKRFKQRLDNWVAERQRCHTIWCLRNEIRWASEDCEDIVRLQAALNILESP